MKHIVRLNRNQYVHLDSYGETSNFVGNVLIGIFVIGIAVITAGAMLGVDVTNPSPVQTPIQQSK